MIKNKSRQTAAMITLDVQKDITSRGWSCMRSEEEAVYDLIVDMGIVDGKREFVTIQVKTSLRTTSRSGGANEPVSKNGKNRNSYSYYDEDVTYLASLNKFGEVEYIHKDDYKYMTTSQLSRASRTTFPINEEMYGYRSSVNSGTLVSLFE